MFRNTGIKVLGYLVKKPDAAAMLVAGSIGLSIGLGSYKAIDLWHYQPRAAQLQMDRRAELIFGEIDNLYYEPIRRQVGRGGFYELSPVEVLERLEQSKKILEDNRKFLEEGGYIGDVTWNIEGIIVGKYTGPNENMLDQATENVRELAEYWPHNREEWFNYLYDGDVLRPPDRNAPEIHGFYSSVRDAKIDVWFNQFRSDGIRYFIPVVAGLINYFAAKKVHQAIKLPLRNIYNKILSEERLRENMEKLRQL